MIELTPYRPYLCSFAIINLDGVSYIAPTRYHEDKNYTSVMCIPTKMLYEAEEILQYYPGQKGMQWIKNRGCLPDTWDYAIDINKYLEYDIRIMNTHGLGTKFENLRNRVYPDIFWCWEKTKEDFLEYNLPEQIHAFALHNTYTVYTSL